MQNRGLLSIVMYSTIVKSHVKKWTEICVTWWHWLQASTLISLKVVGKILIYVMHPVFVLFWDFNNRNRFGKWKWTQKSIIGAFRSASHYYRFIHKKHVNLSKYSAILLQAVMSLLHMYLLIVKALLIFKIRR